MKEKELRRSLAVLPIGTVMKLTDLTARQIRYYEEQGLVIPERNEGNRRMYSLNNIDKLLEVKDYLAEGIKRVHCTRSALDHNFFSGLERCLEILLPFRNCVPTENEPINILSFRKL